MIDSTIKWNKHLEEKHLLSLTAMTYNGGKDSGGNPDTFLHNRFNKSTSQENTKFDLMCEAHVG